MNLGRAIADGLRRLRARLDRELKSATPAERKRRMRELRRRLRQLKG